MGQSSQRAELQAVWLVAASEEPLLTICTDSWAVDRELTLWISTWHTNKWMVMHRPSWGQAFRQDLWELGHWKQITVHHVTLHAPLASPGNDEADPLAMVQWLEIAPASPSGREVAQWLHRCLLYAGQKTMWSTIKTWRLPVTLAEAQDACETCAVCSREHPRRPVGPSGQVELTQWQVDVIGPLPSSEGYKLVSTGMDMATGLLAAYPAWHPDQRAVIAALEQLCAAYG